MTNASAAKDFSSSTRTTTKTMVSMTSRTLSVGGAGFLGSVFDLPRNQCQTAARPCGGASGVAPEGAAGVGGTDVIASDGAGIGSFAIFSHSLWPHRTPTLGITIQVLS